jgi:hypothetical protein
VGRRLWLLQDHIRADFPGHQFYLRVPGGHYDNDINIQAALAQSRENFKVGQRALQANYQHSS